MPQNAYLTGLVAEREDVATAIADYQTRAETRGTDLSDAELGEIQELQTRQVAIDQRLSTFADAQQSNRAYSDLMGRLDTGRQRQEQRQLDAAEQRTPGQQWTESDAFRSYRGHGTSSAVEVETRAPTLLAGLVTTPARITIPEPSEAFPLFGLVDIQTISGNSFDAIVGTFVDNSAVVAEGALKPESTYTETLVPGVLDTIAHWTQLSRQALEDESRVRSVVDGKLTRGVLKRQHESIAAALAAATLPAVSDGGSLLAGIRVGIGTVQEAGFSPNAVLLNPADWAEIDVDVYTQTPNGPTIGQAFWGLRPVAYSGQPVGTATVGAFDEGVTLFRRSGVSVYVTDSHASTFTSNIFTLLAEARSKALVTVPAAFAECSAGTAPVARSASSK
jgi:hypothetical protein